LPKLAARSVAADIIAPAAAVARLLHLDSITFAKHLHRHSLCIKLEIDAAGVLLFLAYQQLIPVTAVRVIVRIAIVAAVSINASTKVAALVATVTETAAIYRDSGAAETAVAHCEPAASETATAKAVTSAAKTTAMASATAVASTAASCERNRAGARCCDTEPDGSNNCYNHLLAHFSDLLMFGPRWEVSARPLCLCCCDWFAIAPIGKGRQKSAESRAQQRHLLIRLVDQLQSSLAGANAAQSGMDDGLPPPPLLNPNPTRVRPRG
jgi:hypothetical protein